MLKESLASFEPTSFSLKLTLFLPKTNSLSNPFFFEIDSIEHYFLAGLPDQFFKNWPAKLFKKGQTCRRKIRPNCFFLLTSHMQGEE